VNKEARVMLSAGEDGFACARGDKRAGNLRG